METLLEFEQDSPAGTYHCQVCWRRHRRRVQMDYRDGVYVCPECGSTLVPEDRPALEDADGRADRGNLVYMGYIPGTRKGSNSSRSRQQSPARQKQDARMRQEMPGIHIRAASLVVGKLQVKRSN